MNMARINDVSLATTQAVNAYVSNSNGAVQQFDIPSRGDRATISQEGLDALENPEIQQDRVSLKTYMDGLSPQEKAYFNTAIAARFSANKAPEYNLAVAMSAAEELTTSAAGKGQMLDIDEAYLSIKKQFGLDQAGSIDLMV